MENETMHTYRVVLALDFEATNPIQAAQIFATNAENLREQYAPPVEVRQFLDTDRSAVRYSVHIASEEVQMLSPDRYSR